MYRIIKVRNYLQKENRASGIKIRMLCIIYFSNIFDMLSLLFYYIFLSNRQRIRTKRSNSFAIDVTRDLFPNHAFTFYFSVTF